MTPYILHDEHGVRCWCATKRVWYWPRAWRYQGTANVYGGDLKPGEKPQPHTYLVRS